MRAPFPVQAQRGIFIFLVAWHERGIVRTPKFSNPITKSGHRAAENLFRRGTGGESILAVCFRLNTSNTRREIEVAAFGYISRGSIGTSGATIFTKLGVLTAQTNGSFYFQRGVYLVDCDELKKWVKTNRSFLSRSDHVTSSNAVIRSFVVHTVTPYLVILHCCGNRRFSLVLSNSFALVEYVVENFLIIETPVSLGCVCLL